MSPQTISALVVTFNHGQYVSEALRSIASQTLQPDEIVVVDDGSTDDTVARVHAEDRRIRVFGDSHRGIERLADSYNVGLSACHGELIALLEGDDLWPPNKLERQVPSFANPEVAVAHGAYAVIGSRGTLLRDRVISDSRVPDGSYDALPLHLLASYVMCVTSVVRRSALIEVGGFRQLVGTPHWDYPTFLALSRRGLFSHTRDVVGIWRKHRGSGTMSLAGRDVGGANLAMTLALQTREELAEDRQLPTEQTVRRSWREASARNIVQVGRILLREGKYAEARRLAWGAMGLSVGPRQRLQLSAIAVAGLGGFDLERASRWLGKRSTIEELF